MSFKAASASEIQPMKIEVPHESLDGSFVVRIQETDIERNIERNKGVQLELWRRYENEQYILVSRQPFFEAISQLLYKPGRYDYKVNLVRQSGDRFEKITSSDVSSVEVKLRTKQLLSGLL